MTDQKNEQNIKKPVFSRHLFIWTFRYDLLNGKGENDYWRVLEKKGWARYPARQSADLRERYALWQNMSREARRVFGDFDPSNREGLCRMYRFGLQDGKEQRYIIKKDNMNYTLTVDALELHLYPFGFGVVILHTTNDGFSDLADVKKIADYGRRLHLPFMPEERNGFIITADSLALILNGQQKTIDFRDQIRRFLEDEGISDEESQSRLFMPYVDAPGIVAVLPQVDDRMFEMELIQDKQLVERLKHSGASWRECDELLKEIYPLVYVDNGGATCADSTMIRDLMIHSVYPRWLGEGTLYAVTEYSMLCITTFEPSAVSFLTQYLYMMSLALAQRSGLFQIAEQTGECNLGKKIDTKKLGVLKKKYNRFCLNMMISRFSDQDQGVDLYRLLLEQLGTSRYQEIVRQQISDTLETAATELQERISNRIAIVAAVLALAQIVTAVLLR